jgi:hypothetical protein
VKEEEDEDDLKAATEAFELEEHILLGMILGN